MFGIENFENAAFSPEKSFPEISGFNEYSELSNVEVDSLVRDLLPASHLDHCASIRCEPSHPFWEENPDAGGVYVSFPSEYSIPSEIVLRGSAALEGTGITETECLLHEIGHNACDVLMHSNPQLIANWSELHEDSIRQYEMTGLGFVSDYARTNMFEDFAESYAEYVANPELVQILCPEKYDFMRDHLFDGREYESVPTSDGSFALVSKEVGSALVDVARQPQQVDGLYETIHSSGQQLPVEDSFRCFSLLAAH